MDLSRNIQFFSRKKNKNLMILNRNCLNFFYSFFHLFETREQIRCLVESLLCLFIATSLAFKLFFFYSFFLNGDIVHLILENKLRYANLFLSRGNYFVFFFFSFTILLIIFYYFYTKKVLIYVNFFVLNCK